MRELGLGTGEHLSAERLGRIATPVRVLCGDRSDPVFADAARRAAAAICGALLVEVPGGGHALQLDAPELVAASVEAVSAELLRCPPSGHSH